jgi:hypothetical protein
MGFINICNFLNVTTPTLGVHIKNIENFPPWFLNISHLVWKYNIISLHYCHISHSYFNSIINKSLNLHSSWRHFFINPWNWSCTQIKVMIIGMRMKKFIHHIILHKCVVNFILHVYKSLVVMFNNIFPSLFFACYIHNV